MKLQELHLLFRQGEFRSDFSLSNQRIVLVPGWHNKDARLTSAFVTQVTDSSKEHSIVLLKYVPGGPKGGDHFSVSTYDPFLQGVFTQRQATIQCGIMAEYAFNPQFATKSTLAMTMRRTDDLRASLQRLASVLEADGDLLNATTELALAQTSIDTLDAELKRVNLTPEMREIPSSACARPLLGTSVMANYGTYLRNSEGSIPTRLSRTWMGRKCTIIDDPTVRHVLHVLANTDVVTQLKRRFWEANRHLLNSA